MNANGGMEMDTILWLFSFGYFLGSKGISRKRFDHQISIPLEGKLPRWRFFFLKVVAAAEQQKKS